MWNQPGKTGLVLPRMNKKGKIGRKLENKQFIRKKPVQTDKCKFWEFVSSIAIGHI